MSNTNSNTTKVLVLATLHHYHKTNPNYSYEDLFTLIEELNPHAIGVEIRPEDVDQPKEYLEKIYPFEMIEAVSRFSAKMDLYGFDWLDSALEGKPVPENFFKEFPVLQAQKQFYNDPLYIKERALLKICQDQQSAIIQSHPTPAGLNNGRYDIVSKIYYQYMDVLLKDTHYEMMSKHQKERDRHIDDNIVEIVRKNEGRTLIFIMGADHRVFAVEAIRNAFGSKVEWIAL